MVLTLPSGKLRPGIVRWPKDSVLHRVHSCRFSGTALNPGHHKQLTRFAPFADTTSKPVPYLYGAGSFDCALYETLFHDIPVADEIRFAPDLTHELAYTEIAFDNSLRLAELTSRALPKLGLTRAQVIDTLPPTYPDTIRLAQRLWLDTNLQGLYWISRQDDRAPCVLLFGDRIPAAKAVREHGVISDSMSLMEAVLAAASAANIVLG